MTTRAEIVACGRTLIDTPFHHQGRLKGVGIDCVGVPILIGHELGLTTFDIKNYPKRPKPGLFRRLCRENLIEIPRDQLLPADLVSIIFEAEQHLALITELEPLTILHAYEKAGRVLEQPARGYWEDRFATCWRFPGVTD